MNEFILQQSFFVFLKSDIGIIILSVLIIQTLRFISQTSVFFSYIYIAGTFLHELAHLIIALLLYAKPTSFSLAVRKSDDGTYRLGAVQISNPQWYNAFPVALSPLVLLPLAFIIHEKLIFWAEQSWWQYIIATMVIITIIMSSFPSQADWKMAFYSKIGALFYSMICVMFTFSYYAYLINKPVLQLITDSNLFF